MSTQIIGVLGLGIFGQTIATELSQFGQEVIALDNDEAVIELIGDRVSKAAVGDITDIDFLRATGIDQCDEVIIATGGHLEASALALLQCKKLGVPKIIAKAKNDSFEEVLYGIGANLVITPERSTAKELASSMLRHNITSIFHLEDDITIVDLNVPKDWVGKTLRQLNLRKTYDVNVVGFRDPHTGHLNTDFKSDQPLQDQQAMTVITNNRTLEKFDYLGYLE